MGDIHALRPGRPGQPTTLACDGARFARGDSAASMVTCVDCLAYIDAARVSVAEERDQALHELEATKAHAGLLMAELAEVRAGRDERL